MRHDEQSTYTRADGLFQGRACSAVQFCGRFACPEVRLKGVAKGGLGIKPVGLLEGHPRDWGIVCFHPEWLELRLEAEGSRNGFCRFAGALEGRADDDVKGDMVVCPVPGEGAGLSAPKVSERGVVTPLMHAFEVTARLPMPCQGERKMFHNASIRWTSMHA